MRWICKCSLLLGWCVNLQATSVTSLAANHSYTAYCINGVWVSHEATSHEESFHIVDPQEDIYMIGSYKNTVYLLITVTELDIRFRATM